MLNKKGQKGFLGLGPWGLAIAVVILLQVFGIFSITDQIQKFTAGAGPGESDTTTLAGTSCLTTDKSTVTFDEEDALVPSATVQTTADTDDGILYSLNGGNLQPSATVGTSVDDGGTVSLSPGNRLDIYWAWDGTSASGGHYASKTSEVVDCTGAQTFTGEVYAHPTTMNLKAFNENGDVMSSGANGGNINATLTADDEQSFDIEYRPGPDTGLAHGGVWVCDYNKTAFDNIGWDFGSGSAPSTTVPNSFSSRGSAFATEGWEFPAKIDTKKTVGLVTLDTSSSFGTAVDFSNTIACQLWDYDYFVTDEGTVLIGAEDTDNNQDVGASSPAANLMLNITANA